MQRGRNTAGSMSDGTSFYSAELFEIDRPISSRRRRELVFFAGAHRRWQPVRLTSRRRTGRPRSPRARLAPVPPGATRVNAPPGFPHRPERTAAVAAMQTRDVYNGVYPASQSTNGAGPRSDRPGFKPFTPPFSNPNWMCAALYYRQGGGLTALNPR